MDKLQALSGNNVLGQIELEKADSHLSRAKSLASKDVKSQEDVEKAAGGFEALLLHQMLKAMWSTVQSTGFLGDDSNQAQIYRDMLNQAIADSVAEGRGVGVKDFLRKELSKTIEPSS
ncbi:MAG: rod-binding protein [Bdellovibrionales bacterium]|nr:rod-binding protein [Bdellovibrionales bacterium]